MIRFIRVTTSMTERKFEVEVFAELAGSREWRAFM